MASSHKISCGYTKERPLQSHKLPFYCNARHGFGIFDREKHRHMRDLSTFNHLEVLLPMIPYRLVPYFRNSGLKAGRCVGR